jgi:transcriptional regulator with XRE-family HTH domain
LLTPETLRYGATRMARNAMRCHASGAHQGKDTLELTQRIRAARKHGGISQAALAQHVGVHRSAVSHWESSKPKRPNIGHLLSIAVSTGVQFEWLATGRGAMLACATMAVSDPGNGIVVDDAHELELLRAFRDVPLQSRPVLVELAQQLGRQRNGRTIQARPTTLMHALRLRLGDDPAPAL